MAMQTTPATLLHRLLRAHPLLVFDAQSLSDHPSVNPDDTWALACEALTDGFQRLYMEGGSNPIWAIFYAALAAFAAPGRWFAMRTSKIPKWPAEVEASCKVVADDPFAIGMK